METVIALAGGTGAKDVVGDTASRSSLAPTRSAGWRIVSTSGSSSPTGKNSAKNPRARR
jgi:hypothetical protein